MRTILCAVGICLGLAGGAGATTKGLNQIFTPDLQPAGTLSLSYQRQDQRIGNVQELQLELGVCKYAEFAVFRGLDPNQWIGALETGFQCGPDLYAAGFANWTTGSGTHTNPQPFVEYGYYYGQHKAIAGAIRVGNQTEAIFGYAYALTDRWQPQVDWQTGSGNSSTLGVTWAATPNLSINPSLYLPNDPPRKLLGYAVVSWTVTAF